MNDDNTALTAALLEIERFVGQSGWDQPARLFALVRTDELIAAEPQLAKELGLRGTADGAPEGALSSIEQGDFTGGEELGEALAQIAWPPTVVGCALAVERSVVPASVEADLPDDPDKAADAVAQHPEHDEVRVVAGALRDPKCEHAVARLRSAGELLGSSTLAPNLTAALSMTLEPTQ